ncbi:MAG: restriction endonuclease [Syntrophobacteraceae bacterium]
MKKRILDLTPDQFENLTFDLMILLGLKNAVWRTPGRDSGRDIQGDFFVSDLSGFFQRQMWYIECKRYDKSVDWPTVWEKISYAESSSSDMLLFVTSSSLSPQCVDEVNKWNESKKHPVIRFWSVIELESKLNIFPQLLVKYKLVDDVVTKAAASILPLTKIALKLTNSAYSSSIFGMDHLPSLEASAAITDLISAKLLDLEESESFSYHPYQSCADSYGWVENVAVLDSSRFDKHAIRAILAYIKYATKSVKLVLTKDVKSESIMISSPRNFFETEAQDLGAIALWGNFGMNISGSNVFIKGVGDGMP